MIFFKYAQFDSLQQCSLAFLLYLSFFSRFSQKTSQTPQFDHFLTTFLPISPDPMSRFCSSSNLASQIKIEVFYKKIHQNRFRFTRVIVMTDRQTDGFFFCIFGFFGSRSVERPYLEVRNREITNSVVNLLEPFTSYGAKKRHHKRRL